MKNFIIGLFVSILILLSAVGGALADRLFVIRPLDAITKRISSGLGGTTNGEVKVVTEENMVIDVADKASPSVVTISISKEQATIQPYLFDPFGMFGSQQQGNGKTEKVQHDIGTGFIVGSDGLIVTNKHVVADTQAGYKVFTKDDTEYEVKNIYRDPVNDLAILKIDPVADKQLVALDLGDSSNLKVGQFVVAIGTALGEFRHTVTAGVISGLGRGIVAGDGFGGESESLENVIQTDAAINPGNSGGPLLNSLGQVIGVNVAVAGGAQGIGFAIPINIVKDSLTNFKETGQFNRPLFGVSYQMLDKDTALVNEVPEGAYVRSVVNGSGADKAGIKQGDIIVSLDGTKVKEVKGGLAAIVSKKKVGDKISVEYWRNNKISKVEVVLEAAK